MVTSSMSYRIRMLSRIHHCINRYPNPGNMVSITAGADVVLRSGVMDVASDIAELLSLREECMDAYLIGSHEGDHIMVDSISRVSDGAVGLCMSDVEGGTAPTDDMRLAMSQEFHEEGVLMVIDPYACEIAVYRVDDGELMPAKVLISE